MAKEKLITDPPLIKSDQAGRWWNIQAYLVNEFGDVEPRKKFDITDQMKGHLAEARNGHGEHG